MAGDEPTLDDLADVLEVEPFDAHVHTAPEGGPDDCTGEPGD